MLRLIYKRPTGTTTYGGGTGGLYSLAGRCGLGASLPGGGCLAPPADASVQRLCLAGRLVKQTACNENLSF